MIGRGWWRFSAYQLTDGFIGPADGATLERYDPLEPAVGRRQGRSTAPYEALLRLINDFRATVAADNQIVPTPETEATLLDWCQQHGLLGLLPHLAGSAFLPPPPQSGAAATMWETTARGWRTSLIATADRLEPTLYIRRDPLAPLMREPIDSMFERFFPGAQPRASVDPVGFMATDAFWHSYREHVTEFLAAATWLRDAQTNDRLLEALAEPASLVLEPAGSRPRQRWMARSLLSQYAVLMLGDRAGGAVARECATCARPFLSRVTTAAYCSERCRSTAAKRRQRAKPPHGGGRR